MYKRQQLECVNCTACIDACDEVMVKINKPKGLIRYDSLEGIEKRRPPRFTPRLAAYTGVLLLLLGGLAYLLLARRPFESTLLRAPGLTYQQRPGRQVSNLYNLEVLNKTFDDAHLSVRPLDAGTRIEFVGSPPDSVAAGEAVKMPLFLILPASKITSTKTEVHLQVLRNGQPVQNLKTNFMGPVE